MDWPLTLAVLFSLLLLFFAAGVPVAFAFITINIAGLYWFLGGATGLTLLAGSAFNSVAQFSLVPIPLFVLMGELLVRSGLAAATVTAADQWIGRVPGRLAIAAIVAGTIFGALNGASMASVAMLGALLVPEMQRQRYKPKMMIAPVLGAGGLAVLIPPSALGVLLGALAKVSISDLLIAAAVPGLILAFLYAAYFMGLAWLRPDLAPPYLSSRVSFWEKIKTLRLILPLSGLMIVVTGFIFLGIATPAEAAAMGAAASALLAALFGKLSWKVVKESTMSTVTTTTMVLLIIVGSSAYSQLLAATGATTGLVELVTGLSVSPLAMVVLMQLVVLALGCFIDAISIMMLTVPIFYPIVTSLGIDPIWFSVLLLIQLELAGITPPFGLLLLVLKGVRPELSIQDIYRASVPIVIMQCSVAGLLMAFPQQTRIFTDLMLR